jgi:PmbA protein
MMLSRDEALSLAERCVANTPADAAEALVHAHSSALTRFANNHIHQNVAEEDATVSVRAVLGTRAGVSSTNRLDEASLTACCRAAAEAARHAPEDPVFPGLPPAAPAFVPDRVAPATLEFGPAQRARAARSMIAQSASRGLTAAGKVQASQAVVAIANSLGVRASMPLTEARANVLSMGAAGGSGWADFAGTDATMLAAVALGDQAATTALRSPDPETLDAGAYTVVLSPNAVGTIIEMLGYTGFSAKAVEEGSSFMSGHLGELLLSELVTIVDDATAPDALGLTFDFEGVPKRRTPIVERGVALGPVTDSYWAARTGRPNTGHALPAPNAFGPYPLDLRMEPGDMSEEEMVACVDRGVYVSRFHYVNVEDPVRARLTGMTRDGTFLIEDGRLTRPLKNLRFTQSVVTALRNVRAVGRECRYAADDEGSPPFVPALLIDGFHFTGQTR